MPETPKTITPQGLTKEGVTTIVKSLYTPGTESGKELLQRLVDNARQEGFARVSVTAIIWDKEGILALRRAKGDSLPGKFVMPGGGLDEGETIEQAVTREVREETGLEVTSIDEYVGYTDLLSAKKGEPVRRFFFIVTAKPGAVVLDEKEHDGIALITSENIDKYSIVENELPIYDYIFHRDSPVKLNPKVVKITEQFRSLGIWTDTVCVPDFLLNNMRQPATPAQIFGEMTKVLIVMDPKLPKKLLEIFKNLRKIGYSDQELGHTAAQLGNYWGHDSIYMRIFIEDLHTITLISKDKDEFWQRWRRLDAAKSLREQSLFSGNRNVLLSKLGRGPIHYDDVD